MSSIHVVGSINLDLVAFADRMPEPGETLRGSGFQRNLGGKGANQAVAAARAGAHAVMVGAVGNAPADRELLDSLAGYGVDVRRVETVDDSSGVGFVLVAGGDNRIVIVPGANERIDPARVAELDLKEGDLCLVQWETRSEVVRAALERARSRRAATLFNPAPARPEARPLFPLADLIVVNETECGLFAGAPLALPVSDEALRSAGRAMDLRPEQVLVVTLGAAGAKALVSDRIIGVPGHAVPVVDTTGAGDCFCGYLAAGLCRGESLEDALREANAAAALSVQAKGAASAIPTRERVRHWLEQGL